MSLHALRLTHVPGLTKGDLRQMLADNPLPSISADVVPQAPTADEATALAVAALDRLNAALTARDVKAVEACFFASQSYWKDNLALTYHLRTFSTAARVASSLVETAELRQVGPLQPEGPAQFNPVLVGQFQLINPPSRFANSWIEIRRLWFDIEDGLAGRQRKWQGAPPPRQVKRWCPVEGLGSQHLAGEPGLASRERGTPQTARQESGRRS